MSSTAIAHAPGFIAGDRPQIVTSRFRYDDAHTLDRFLATDGYEGLKAALAKMGLITEAYRQPLWPMADGTRARLYEAMEGVGLIG